MIVVTIVVRRSSGENSAAMLGRLSVPALFFCCQIGDSGRNGRIRISGIAGMHAGHQRVAPRRVRILDADAERDDRRQAAPRRSTHRPLTVATSRPPSDENACV